MRMSMGEGADDEAAPAERLTFERLARERRSEIKVHCYRMLGSRANVSCVMSSASASEPSIL